MNNNFSKSYIKFCSLLAALRALPTILQMSVPEELVLKKLIVLWGNGARVSVMGFMKDCGTISPTTVHRVLEKLKKSKMIALIEDEVDARRKFIHPTKLCEKYLAQMDQVVVDANNYDQASSLKPQASSLKLKY